MAWNFVYIGIKMSEESLVSSGDDIITEDVLRAQIKPLSDNALARFFQRVYRKWLGVWYLFADKHPKLSELVYKIVFFFVFSISVTIWQYVVMTFLPYAFEFLNNGPAGWPGVLVGGTGQQYIIFGDTQGWGYFIAFEIAVFTAQCINFPLQRNITYRSHGNPWFQAMWYFIGWALISVATNALWGIINVYFVYWGVPDAVTGLVKTLLTGLVSMIIFFFIFMVIFPDDNAAASKAKKRYDRLNSRGAPQSKIEKAKSVMDLTADKANKSNARKEYEKAVSQASGKAVRYFAFKDTAEKTEDGAEKAALSEKLEILFAEAVDAVKFKTEKENIYNTVVNIK